MDYVLITGATSGIGYELALTFAKNGYGLILVSTSVERLESVKAKIEMDHAVSVYIYPQDLSVLGAAKALYGKIKKNGQEIAILVNNAGCGFIGATEEIGVEADEQMMILNMVNLTNLSKLVVKEMYARKQGKVLNVASTGAFQPGPYTASYFASKSYVLSYSRAIRYEARRNGVQICTLCPGTTDTNFFKRAGKHTPSNAMPPRKVAEIAYKGLMKNKELIVPGLLNKILRIVPVNIKIAGVAKMKAKQSSKST